MPKWVRQENSGGGEGGLKCINPIQPGLFIPSWAWELFVPPSHKYLQRYSLNNSQPCIVGKASETICFSDLLFIPSWAWGFFMPPSPPSSISKVIKLTWCARHPKLITLAGQSRANHHVMNLDKMVCSTTSCDTTAWPAKSTLSFGPSQGLSIKRKAF